MQKLLIFVALLVFANNCEATRLTRCQLVRELRRQGFPDNLMRHWVCLIESESNRYTSKVSRRNSDGSRDYGLFQINDRLWCTTGSTPGKDCNVRCRDLLTRDITNASNCAKIIYRRHGFQAWYGWRSKCQRTLPNISSC